MVLESKHFQHGEACNFTFARNAILPFIQICNSEIGYYDVFLISAIRCTVLHKHLN